MPNKFHINSKGVPAPCRAVKGNCPFGGDETHYNSKEDAQIAADKMNEEKHSILPGVNQSDKSTAYKEMEEKLTEGKIDEVEKQMSYHKAKDIAGAYNVLQEMRKRGNIQETIKQLRDERNFISKQYFDKRKNIEDDLYSKSNHIKELEREQVDLTVTIDEVNEKVKENNSGDCPKCGKGKLIERKSKYGTFIGCNRFPDCKHNQKKLEANPALNKKMEKLEYNYKIATQKLENEAVKIQESDSSSVELKERMDKLGNEIKVAEYIDKYKNPKVDRLYPGRSLVSKDTPIEEYYQNRREADQSIKAQIGENDLVLNSGKMSYGQSKEVKADLKINKHGEIDNLYLEDTRKPGEVKKVICITNHGSLQLDGGETITFQHASNWRMRSSDDGPHNTWKLYATKSKQKKKYDGQTKVRYDHLDSSD